MEHKACGKENVDIGIKSFDTLFGGGHVTIPADEQIIKGLQFEVRMDIIGISYKCEVRKILWNGKSFGTHF